jgi:hypothetical protein
VDIFICHYSPARAVDVVPIRFGALLTWGEVDAILSGAVHTASVSIRYGSCAVCILNHIPGIAIDVVPGW